MGDMKQTAPASKTDEDVTPLDRDPIVADIALRELVAALQGVASATMLEAAKAAAERPARVRRLAS
jgi:hypothetical protein